MAHQRASAILLETVAPGNECKHRRDGFDTRDLKEAKALLEELSNAAT
jgi:hypothetical protein